MSVLQLLNVLRHFLLSPRFDDLLVEFSDIFHLFKILYFHCIFVLKASVIDDDRHYFRFQSNFNITIRETLIKVIIYECCSKYLINYIRNKMSGTPIMINLIISRDDDDDDMIASHFSCVHVRVCVTQNR